MTWGDYGNGFWEGDQLRDSEPKDPNKGIEDAAVHDAKQQVKKRDQAYVEGSKILSTLSNQANTDIALQIASHLTVYEEWAYRRTPAQPFFCTEETSPKICFVSEPIRNRGRIQQPVCKVAFRLVTRDQGFIISPVTGSHTWYTVGIIPAAEASRPVTAPEPDESTDATFSGTERSSLYAEGNLEEPQSVLPLYRNKHARYDFDVNTITWTSDMRDQKKAAWVKSLKLGDRLVIRAHAQHAGWRNLVRCISVVFHNRLAL